MFVCGISQGMASSMLSAEVYKNTISLEFNLAKGFKNEKIFTPFDQILSCL